MLSAVFILFGPSLDWMMPTHIGEGDLLSPETPSQTHPEIMFNLGTPWPVNLTHKIDRHRWVIKYSGSLRVTNF